MDAKVPGISIKRSHQQREEELPDFEEEEELKFRSE